MDDTAREPAPPRKPPQLAAGEWYVKGFADGYHARLAVIPVGTAGEQYNKGYDEGLEIALRDCLAAHWELIS
jgi:hypothetical protein